MNPRVNRRAVLIATAVVGVGAALPALALLATAPEDVVERIVRLRFPGVAITPEDLREFARDFLVSDRTSTAKLAALRVGIEVLQSPSFAGLAPERVHELYERFERRVVTRFALSTGFFEHVAASREPLRYRGLADPYQMPCANPLAVLDLAAS
jgi:hypothetical protein